MATRSITDMIRSHGFGDALEERVNDRWWKKLKNFFSGRGSHPISCRYTVIGDKTAEDGEVILSSNVDHNLVDKSADKIVKTVRNTGAVVTGPIPLPMG